MMKVEAEKAEMATEAARLMLGKAGEWKGAVGVMRTKVTKAAVEKFKKALPKCRIQSNF